MPLSVGRERYTGKLPRLETGLSNNGQAIVVYDLLASGGRLVGWLDAIEARQLANELNELATKLSKQEPHVQA